MRIVQCSDSGYELHDSSEPGKSLIGWYSSKTKVMKALKGFDNESLSVLFKIISFVQLAKLLSKSSFYETPRF